MHRKQRRIPILKPSRHILLAPRWRPINRDPSPDHIRPPQSSRSQALAEADLTQEDWDAYIAVLEGEDESAKRNWNCWFTNYMSGCTRCPPCPGPDPFGDVSGEN